MLYYNNAVGIWRLIDPGFVFFFVIILVIIANIAHLSEMIHTGLFEKLMFRRLLKFLIV